MRRVLATQGGATASVVLLCAVLTACSSSDRAPARPEPAAPPKAVAKRSCDRYASPAGSDRASGSRERPFRSAHRLVRELGRNQTGCLLPGLYTHRGIARLRFPGSSLQGIGRGRARIRGPIWITSGATGASLSGVVLTSRDPVYSTPLKVQADRARVFDNRIFGSSNTTCVIVASARRASGILIERNRISHCGRVGKLDHLIYVEQARGLIVRGNVLTDNPGGWAVHLYPDAEGTRIEHNVIDNNQGGVIFAGEGSTPSSDNVVRANVISYSAPRWNVESFWGGDVGTGNLAQNNCLTSAGPGAPSGLGEAVGFVAGPNRVVLGSPYRDRLHGDLRLKRDSPCRALTGDPAADLASPAR